MKRLLSSILLVLMLLSCIGTAFATETVDPTGESTPESSSEPTESTPTETTVPKETEAPTEEDKTDACGDNLSWFYANGVLTVTGSGDMFDFDDGAPWASLKNSITKVILSGGVTSVGANAFTDYDKITEVDFGSSLVFIGDRSFRGCDGLTTLSMPKTFRRFGEESLRNCKNLKEIHCAGSFPRFDLNCLWETKCQIIYPASAPWSVTYIEQLENAFHGRIEFIDSNGGDHYTYTEPTEATTAPTTAPTTEATTEATTQATTEATTVPTTEPETTEVITEPETEEESFTAETLFFGTNPIAATEKAPKKASGGGIGIAIVVITLSLCGGSALVYRGMNKRK